MNLIKSLSSRNSLILYNTRSMQITFSKSSFLLAGYGLIFSSVFIFERKIWHAHNIFIPNKTLYQRILLFLPSKLTNIYKCSQTFLNSFRWLNERILVSMKKKSLESIKLPSLHYTSNEQHLNYRYNHL